MPIGLTALNFQERIGRPDLAITKSIPVTDQMKRPAQLLIKRTEKTQTQPIDIRLTHFDLDWT
ncbi:hypothetical protein GCM10011404_34290 [Sphingomonas prati]|nr:hypothetical protein GCM10011404_34290 [Sphingomonas prati]